jgi:hypothetical protein
VRIYPGYPSIAQVVLIVAGLALAASPALADQPAKRELPAKAEQPTEAEPAWVEQRARVETSVLYSNLRSGGESAHSHRFGITVFLNRHFGLDVEAINGQGLEDELLFGPQIRLFEKGRVGVRLHTRVGWANRLYNCYPPCNREGFPSTGASVHEWNFASMIGPSVDVLLAKGWAWRVIQPEMVWWRREGNHTEFRVSSGLMIRFGKTD